MQRARQLAPIMFVALLCWIWLTRSEYDAQSVIGHAVIRGTCGLVGVVAIAARLRFPNRWGHLALAILWWSAAGSTLTAAYYAVAPQYAALFPLEIFAAVALLDTASAVASLSLAQIVWIAITLRDGGPNVATAIATSVTAQAFAIVIQIGMRRALKRQIDTAASLELQLAERTRLEEQLMHAQRMEAVGTLAAGLAHDMNNVLAGISNVAGLMIEDDRPSRDRADLEQIVAQAMRGASLTRGLLAFSRKGQYRRKVVRIDDVVREVTPSLQRTLAAGITIRTELAGAESCVEGDPMQLGQTVINLAINAADAMNNAGTLTISTDITELDAITAGALAVPVGCYARMRITDSGPGMDDATRRRVFEPFFTTKDAGKGTGLGLSIVWGIVQSHRGSVSVESTSAFGTTFSVVVPVCGSSQTPRTSSGEAPLVKPRSATVLVVDDEPALRAGTARVLKRAGMTSYTAENGAEAIKLFREHAASIDLVILDMAMPVMTGAECFRELRKLSDVPVIVATGYFDAEDVRAMVAVGCRLLEKPYMPAALLLEVHKLLSATTTARDGVTSIG